MRMHTHTHNSEIRNSEIRTFFETCAVPSSNLSAVWGKRPVTAYCISRTPRFIPKMSRACNKIHESTFLLWNSQETEFSLEFNIPRKMQKNVALITKRWITNAMLVSRPIVW
jgi:hypothetical protein